MRPKNQYRIQSMRAAKHKVAKIRHRRRVAKIRALKSTKEKQ